jgi:hypothetical protein
MHTDSKVIVSNMSNKDSVQSKTHVYLYVTPLLGHDNTLN